MNIKNFGWNNKKKYPKVRIYDTITQDIGYTIKTKLGTLYRNLPNNYKIKGKIIKKEESFYQNNIAYKFTMERISKSPKNKRLRKNYFVWQLKNGILIK